MRERIGWFGMKLELGFVVNEEEEEGLGFGSFKNLLKWRGFMGFWGGILGRGDEGVCIFVRWG